MSRKGNCWDNSAMESFFKTLFIQDGCWAAVESMPETATGFTVELTQASASTTTAVP